MMMRLAFAVQVLCDPDILIIDEALSVGDFFFQQKCMRYIRGLCDKGVTLLFVSHDMGAVRDVCKRGIFLNKGRVVFDGDNLEAIRLYLQPTDPAPNNVANDNLHASGVGWSLNKEALGLKKSKSAYLLSVGMFDLNGVPIASARLNSEVIIRAHYKSSSGVAPHVHVVFKNKYDQIITAVGSHSLGVTAPKLDLEQEATFELQMRLALEGGSYAYNVSLSIPNLNGVGGELIDESPWIGPCQVSWNYEEEVPPFYGLAGMESSARFIV
jgi:lipopolysaccharide transport system ATP-binding protein